MHELLIRRAYEKTGLDENGVSRKARSTLGFITEEDLPILRLIISSTYPDNLQIPI